ncbi:growth-regulating factor 8-like isoform X1 [Brassica napus]|uniref:growth-regulating factor 8-like isoform X1 n=1 Tax=Brassica napus TaxID=3708 RepID=UPI0020789BE1|nr:growth-regulating factor 8-like isoform X1 [Brassica napus]XP_048597388.1 growth-regulating factor 8-like isoform X1 [Brassica napus]XP_048597391.1 growth-regulating factor 8-like isoform X1 [Brassica napus]XP_048597394.1 growth-regulating factor 8-like isoform X1 [Brassica napus]XP_048597398.1 growth-regulating factor 8-like isoform X1 [Brassica napus]XP_048597402.1 growth-regulating factor 8-like isoform X1 [Brassica napus]XP_048597404.1 growth-regulating factor 8-like isoform X1 [Brassi
MMGTRAEHNKEDFVGCGFGFGVVEPSHREVMIPSHHHHHYPSYISPSSYSGSAGVTDPVFSSSTNHAYTCSLGEMYSLAGSNSAAVSAADPLFTLSSSGEMGRSMSEKEGAAAAAFSESQWQELERQRNIYEYIMASLPVPPELLTPFPKHPSHTYHHDVAKGGSLKLGFTSNASNNAADMEPWRCKRTDGKKWRCSRSAVPDQKYCERHTHKSRPRSRKHVESSQHNDTRTTKNAASHYAGTYPQLYGQPVNPFSNDHREFRWFMKEDDSNANLNPAVGPSRELKLGFDYDLNFRQEEALVNQSFGALEGLLSPNRQETRRFFVEGDQDEAMGSSLTLSMAGGGMEEAERRRNQQDQWVSHEGPSWICYTSPGGPLAEALFLGASNDPSVSTTTSSCSRSSG